MTFNKNTTAYLEVLNLTFTTHKIEFLNELQSAHIAKFSFNSLGVLLNGKINVDSKSVFEKIVIEQLGGYCFEHNKLVYDVLTDLGFETKMVIAKVGSDITSDSPRTHRITLVTLNNDTYIVDTGFGPSTAVYPIKLEPLTKQNQGSFQYQVQYIESVGEYTFDVYKEDKFVTLYSFNQNTYHEADCIVANFYSYQHPEAAFVNNIVVSTKTLDETRSLRNGLFLKIKVDNTDNIEINNSSTLQSVLRNYFSLEISEKESNFLFNKHIKV